MKKFLDPGNYTVTLPEWYTINSGVLYCPVVDDWWWIKKLHKNGSILRKKLHVPYIVCTV
jgi:hypothetical protein